MPLTLRIDPRPISYESAIQIEEDDAGDVDVNPYVERVAGEWAPITPERRELPETVAFVDGVQRVEMRVIGDQDGRIMYGALASMAVGAAFYAKDGGRTEPRLPQRVLALSDGGGETPSMSVDCGQLRLDFGVTSSAVPGFAGVYDALTSARREAETRLGEQLVEVGHPLVIVDGRLNFQSSRTSMAVGLIKTMQKQYLQGAELAVLSDLRVGTRTPLFWISRDRAMYSWYLRLADCRAIDHRWSGLVRMETLEAIGVNAAVRLADVISQHLPRFASRAGWDPRAPQNLYPIAALESVLRRRLGDHEFIRRSIEAHFQRMVAAA